MHCARWALAFALTIAGSSSAARMAMMEITQSNSMRVKAYAGARLAQLPQRPRTVDALEGSEAAENSWLAAAGPAVLRTSRVGDRFSGRWLTLIIRALFLKNPDSDFPADAW